MSHSVLHAQTQSFLLDRAVGERVGVASRRQEAQVALWCSEMKTSCHVGEKPCLCHVYGDFSPKRHGIIRNKKTKLKKKRSNLSLFSGQGRADEGDVGESPDSKE